MRAVLTFDPKAPKMGGMLRSLWRRPNLDHDVENPLPTSAAAQVDLDARPPFGGLAPDLPDDPPDDVPPPADHASRLPISSSLVASNQSEPGFEATSLGDSGCCHSTLPTVSGRYQPPRLLDLTNELKMVNWHKLGVQLRLPPEKLKEIEENYPTSYRRLYEVLEYWLNDETDPSWDKICEALLRMGGFARIVHELKVKYCSLSELFCSSITCARCNQLHCKFK